jgi:acetylglutamate/LysW-gamma-L-alpha-aminoadipate kinase
MTTVVKIGGARAVDPAGALSDVATLVNDSGEDGEGDEDGEDGEDVVVVHGGSTAVDETLERLGLEPEYVETPSGVVGRFTDEETMEVFEMVFGHLNTQLVASLQTLDVGAVGLSGVDGKLLYGPRKSAVRVIEGGKRKIRRGDHSGSIKQVNAGLLETLLADGYTPVAGPPMAGADEDGVIPVNTDADRSAAHVAGALDATLVLLTDVEGIYRDPDDATTLIESVETPAEWDELEDAAEGFMGRKVMALREALAGGADEVVVADANARDPVLSALGGGGTHVFASALEDADGESTADDSSAGEASTESESDTSEEV